MSAPANDRPRLAPSARADANEYTFIFGAIRALGDSCAAFPSPSPDPAPPNRHPTPSRSPTVPTEPLTGLEPVTSALPRMRSTTELQRLGFPIRPRPKISRRARLVRTQTAARWCRVGDNLTNPAPRINPDQTFGLCCTHLVPIDSRCRPVAAAVSPIVPTIRLICEPFWLFLRPYKTFASKAEIHRASPIRRVFPDHREPTPVREPMNPRGIPRPDPGRDRRSRR